MKDVRYKMVTVENHTFNRLHLEKLFCRNWSKINPAQEVQKQ